MTRIVSLGTKVKQVHGLVGTSTMGKPDLSAWETSFIDRIFHATSGGDHTSVLSDSQVEKLEEIWEKHFS